MSPLYINLLSALAISVVIACMVSVKSARAKSIILVLPIPITIALLGSGGQVTSLSIVGLALTNCFVWTVFYLYKKGWNILLADIFAAVMYVVIAYVLTKYVQLSFTTAVTAYVLVWLCIVIKLKKVQFKNNKQSAAKASLVSRSATIFGIAFLLFSLKQYLAAFVVTFPYNTVFAVYENRQNLFVQAALFTRNSLALAVYFVANYCLTSSGSHWYAYVASLVAFAVTIIAINKKIPFSIS
jgi:hypothetical protein